MSADSERNFTSAPSIVEARGELEESLDQVFLLIMGIIVLMMQCGFAFLEAGSVRSRNTTNLLIKNLLDSSVAGLAYWTLGFAFAHGNGNGFIGWHHWASSNLPNSGLAFFFFQFVFAATASTIVSGALAERCEMVAYFVYSFAITALIYPVVTHWAWSDQGWLVRGLDYEIDGAMVNVYYHDFAGSGVVHCLGGTAAFTGALILGPRIGRFHPESKTVIQLRGHSLPLTALGGFILLFGFLAFNGGSQLSISKPGDGAIVSLTVVNTVISGSTAAIVTLFIRRIGILGRKWSLVNTLNGALSGMVAVCSGCNVYRTWAAPIVGAIAGMSFNITSWFMCKIKVDDPVDAVAVHFGGGTWGVIAVAFLRADFGILMNWDKRSGLMLAWQLTGLFSIITWTGGLCSLMFGIMKLTGIFRVSEEMERKGLDIPKHGEPAYPLESFGHGYVEKITIIAENGDLSSSHLGYHNGGVSDGRDPGLYENPEVNVMNHLHARYTPDNELASQNSVGNKRKIDGQINAAYVEGAEWTAL